MPRPMPLSTDVAHMEIAHSDILDGIEGPIDVILANPPYLVDAKR